MSLGITITRDDATPTLRRLMDGLTDRRDLNRAIANRAQAMTRKHLVRLSRSRHDSARRLGARPTGHLGRAAESVSVAINQSESSTISVTSPGISRALHDVEIKPVNGNWLTIPIHKLAYGKTAWEVSRTIGVSLFRPGAKGKKKKVLSAVERGGKLVNFFALTKSVHLKQDRTLLPSDDEYLGTANLGARDYVRLLKRRQA